MICQECAINFPDGLVQPLVQGTTGGQETTTMLCGVCALSAVRRQHGNPTLMFKGPGARRIYEASKAHRDKVKGGSGK